MPTDRNEGETRKIQFSGRSSYMFALPKKWIDEMKLGAGDELFVSRKGGTSLLISPRTSKESGGKKEAVIEVDPKDSKGHLIRKLVSMYILGYSIIHLSAKQGVLTSSQRDTVKEVIRRNLIGTEVIADSTAGITIQVLLSFPELSVEDALKRMLLIASSMHKDAILSLAALNEDSAHGVIKSDDEVDRFGLYLIRQLKLAVENSTILEEIKLGSPKDCLGYRLIIKSVERIGDHASKIAQGVLLISKKLDKPLLNDIRELSDYSLSMLEESGLALFKRDYDAADRVVEKATSIEVLEEKLLMALERGRQVESYQTIRLIIEHIRRTAEYASDIAEIVLNLTAEKTVLKAK